jgi:DNA (cytosine-5)-methyltransferase 1
MEREMRFGSVCSGIEAASVAWHPLGWKAAWLSEIEPFPSAVLAHHYPDVPNLGDMTTLPERILSGEVEAPDLFCGGTPCQAFSVAGLRNSLDDARGNLSLTFVGIANAIDHVRSVRGESASIVFWENVPGVLSTKDNAFGCFLAGLAGEDNPLEPTGGKWTNAGYVLGPKRAVAWRLLDAQYFGVAQRRKRVFVVASARADFDPAAVLFEFDGVRRDIAPSREAGKTIAPCVTNSAPFSRTGNERVEAEAMVVQPAYAIQGSMIGRNDSAGPKGDGINEEVCFTQNTIDRHAVFQPIALQDVTTREKAQNGKGWNDDGTSYTVDTHATQGVAQPIPLDMRNAGRDPEKHDEMNRQGVGVGEPGDPAHTVTSAFVHAVAQPIAFAQNQRDEVRIMQVAGALAAEPGAKQQTYLAQPIIGGVDYENNAHGPDDVTGPLLKGSPTGGGRPLPAIALQSMAVRRLTPVECERLQGFPDNYTNIPWRKKDESPDGPRYKALGNSWAVPNVRWIGKRIQEALNALP